MNESNILEKIEGPEFPLLPSKKDFLEAEWDSILASNRQFLTLLKKRIVAPKYKKIKLAQFEAEWRSKTMVVAKSKIPPAQKKEKIIKITSQIMTRLMYQI